jgi:hypothetical protein
MRQALVTRIVWMLFALILAACLLFAQTLSSTTTS